MIYFRHWLAVPSPASIRSMQRVVKFTCYCKLAPCGHDVHMMTFWLYQYSYITGTEVTLSAIHCIVVLWGQLIRYYLHYLVNKKTSS